MGKHPQAIAVGLEAERLRTGMRLAREAIAEAVLLLAELPETAWAQVRWRKITVR